MLRYVHFDRLVIPTIESLEISELIFISAPPNMSLKHLRLHDTFTLHPRDLIALLSREPQLETIDITGVYHTSLDDVEWNKYHLPKMTTISILDSHVDVAVTLLGTWRFSALKSISLALNRVLHEPPLSPWCHSPTFTEQAFRIVSISNCVYKSVSTYALHLSKVSRTNRVHLIDFSY